MSELQTTIPKGSLVLVTGVTGYVASQLAKQFLERGYKVRGTLRDLKRGSWLVEDVLKPYADSGDLELVVVADLAADHAFDEAVKGVSAVLHVATIGSFDPDPNKVVPQTVAGAISVLEAAMKEPSVREFVYTSTIAAATVPVAGNSTYVDKDTWNDAAVKAAWAPPPYEPSRGMVVYWASKVAAEKAVWKFAADNEPHFNINVISPALIIGLHLYKDNVGLTNSWIPALYNGDTSCIDALPAFLAGDVKDIALLHIAAALDPEVKNARIQAWGHYSSWNKILAIMRKLYPQRKFVPDVPDLHSVDISTDLNQPLALLKKWGNQDGWTPLEETVAGNLARVE